MNVALSTNFIITRRYVIEPGDATRYNFMLHWFQEPDEHPVVGKSEYQDYEINTYVETDVHPSRVIPGIKNHLKDYVGITITMPYDTGSYEFMLSQLREESGNSLVDYAAHNMRDCSKVVIAPILAAASVLAFEPDNLQGAILAMREAAKSREVSRK